MPPRGTAAGGNKLTEAGVQSVGYWHGNIRMELFKNTNFDFLGKKWPFIIASLVLTVLGLGSIAMKGGLKYGIDFRGGAMMYVKFTGPPPLDKIRSALSSKIGAIDVQSLTG